MKEWINKLLSANGGVSSKRVCGVISWIIIIGVFIYCTITQKDSPEMTDTLIFATMALLGIDSVANIFNHKRE